MADSRLYVRIQNHSDFVDGTVTAVEDWLDENITPTTPAVDASLSVQGAAADAKKTGDEIADLKSEIQTALQNMELLRDIVSILQNGVFTKDVSNSIASLMSKVMSGVNYDKEAITIISGIEVTVSDDTITIS